MPMFYNSCKTLTYSLILYSISSRYRIYITHYKTHGVYSLICDRCDLMFNIIFMSDNLVIHMFNYLMMYYVQYLLVMYRPTGSISSDVCSNIFWCMFSIYLPDMYSRLASFEFSGHLSLSSEFRPSSCGVRLAVCVVPWAFF